MNRPISPPPAPEILDPDRAERLGRYLSQIVVEQPKFLELFENPRYDYADMTRSAFERRVAHILAGEERRAFETFREAGLLKRAPGVPSGGMELFAPTCRVNYCFSDHDGHKKAVFVCTDSPIVDFNARVFPWADEGEALYSCVSAAWHGEAPQQILDVCSGAGTAGLLLSKRWPKAAITAIDNDERALLYAEFNAKLNGVHSYRVVRHDLAGSKPLANVLGCDGFDIVVIDPPFTPMPEDIVGYAHSSGTHALEGSVREGLAQVRKGGLGVLVCYAFGSKETVTQLDELLGKLDLSGMSVEREYLDHRLWRLNGKKRNPLNPMPVQYMAPRYLDPDWNPKFVANEFSYENYVFWIERHFVERGLTHLHYMYVLFRRDF